MVTVISRFRVANQKVAEVAQAFRDRPRLVENAAGFRGIEILQGSPDPSIFYLYTKWETTDCFLAWHSSAAHRESHAFIPDGLKLDASYTRVEILHDEAPGAVHDLGTFLSAFVSASRRIFHVRLDRDGTIQACSPAFTEALGIAPESVVGRRISEFLVEFDAAPFSERIHSAPSEETFILNFAGPGLSPFSVRASLFIHESGCVLMAERDEVEESTMVRELIDLNNEFARLTRENQQKTRELTEARDNLHRAIKERDESFWFVRKTLKVLPICLSCHKVKSSGTSWESLNNFLLKNSNFLSHGYCPECLSKLLEEGI